MTTKPETTRPFVRGHQQSGAPIQCLNGFAAKICEWVGNTAIGYFTSSKGEAFAAQWNAEGREAQHFAHAGAHDLVMTPLGMIEGKPFFVGDDIVGASGGRFFAEPRDKNGDHDKWAWPVSAPVIQTKMTDEELVSTYFNGGPVHHSKEYQAWRRLADAGIANAQFHGQVVSKEAHEAALVRLGDELRGCAIVQSVEARAARDMAVAKAVQDFFSASLRAHGYSESANFLENYPSNYAQIISKVL